LTNAKTEIEKTKQNLETDNLPTGGCAKTRTQINQKEKLTKTTAKKI